MMAITSFGLPRRPYLEFYLNNDWRNLISHIRQTSSIKIERSRKNEQAKPTPSEMSFVMDDGPEMGNGDYSPRNPMGQWYPNFTRNIPVRYGFEVTDDDFNRTVASGLGTSSQGAEWAVVSAGTVASSVGSGVATHSVTTTSSFIMSLVDNLVARNLDVSLDTTIDSISNVTGGALEPANLVMRYQDVNNYYFIRMSISTAEVVTLAIHKISSGSEIVLQAANTLSTAYSGQQWTIRAQMDGRTIRAKAWPTASAEPLNWNIQHVLVDTQIPFPAGKWGFRSGVGTSNSNTKPILFRNDNFTLRHPRFTGETTEVVPKMDLSENLRVTEIECGTIFRRMQQRKSPAKSTLRRYVENNVAGLIGYWPCEEERFSTQLASGIPGGPPMQLAGGITDVFAGTTSATGGITTEFAADDSIACSAPLPHNNLSTWVVYLTDYPDNSRFDIRFLRRLPTSGNTSPAIPLWSLEFFNRGSANRWIITNEGSPEGALAIQVYDRSGNIYTSPGGTLPSVFDRTLLWYFQMAQNVTDIDWSLSYVDVSDGTFTNYAAGTILNQTIGRAISLASISGLQGQDWSPKDMVVGHIMIGRTQVASSSFFDPVVAYFGETAAARLYRLATEYDLPVIAQVHPDDTTALMGPQLVDTLLDILIECGSTDMGLFGDSRGTNALSYLCLEKIYGQTSTCTLDHDLGHLAEPFEPTDDDANTVNDVTAKARRGSSIRLEQTTGALNVNDPGTAEGAVGRYDESLEVNPGSTNQLRDSAAWALHLGTTDEPRFPEINVKLHDSVMLDDINLTLSVLDLDFGDVLTATNLETWNIYGDIKQLILGYTEILTDQYQHDIQYNTGPFNPYHVGKLGEIRLDSSDSSLSSGIDNDDTVFNVTTPDVLTRWVVEADQINTAWTSATSGSFTQLTVSALAATEISIGDSAQLYTAVGVLKEATTFTISNKTTSGATTTLTLNTAAAATINSGDRIRTWITSNFPFDIVIGGEVMTVTDINLTSDPQQFVVTRSVNSVVKSHSSGAKVQLAEPYYLAK